MPGPPEITAQRDVGEQIQTFLGEYKVVLTALAVLFGFQLTIAFSAGFDDTPPWLRMVNFLALACTALSLVFLLAPISYHRFTHGIEESYAYLHLAQRNAGAGFAFMAGSIALSVFLTAHRSFGDLAFSLATTLGLGFLMLLAWWGLPAVRAVRRGAYGRKWLPHEDPDESEHPRRARRRDA